jgi:hypothetical protein
VFNGKELLTFVSPDDDTNERPNKVKYNRHCTTRFLKPPAQQQNKTCSMQDKIGAEASINHGVDVYHIEKVLHSFTQKVKLSSCNQ